MKECSICKEIKPYELFVKRNNRENAYQCYCKKCHNDKMRNSYNSNKMKDYDLKRSYGIDLEFYENMFKEQNGCCKICNKHINELNQKHKKNLCVDHNHETMKIRGLLCDKCNRGLGLFCDNEDLLLKAINYLKLNN